VLSSPLVALSSNCSFATIDFLGHPLQTGTNMDIGLKSTGLSLKTQAHVVIAILNSIPSPIAVRSGNGRWWSLNSAATRLTGFSGQDFQRNPTLWIEHVHPQDRDNLLAAWERLRNGEKKVSCKYRFFPKKNPSEIWLRDVSQSCPVMDEETSAICSAYTHLSDLNERKHTYREEANPRYPAETIIRGLTHAIQNNLQTIIGEIEFLNLPATAPSEYLVILNKVHEIDRFLREAKDFFYPDGTPHSAVNPVVILNDLQRDVGEGLADHGIRVSMVCRDTLLEVIVDPKAFRNAVKQVIDFSLLLLPNGGEVLLDARRKTIRGTEFVELSITSISESPLAYYKEEDVFRPFVRVNDHVVGLSMAIAQEVFRRQRGNIIFRKESQNRSVFTVLMEVHSH